MRKVAVIPVRNDNYGYAPGLFSPQTWRAYNCLRQNINIFDEIIYVEWKHTPGTNTLLQQIEADYGTNLDELGGTLTELVVSKESVEQHFPEYANYHIVESIARNVGIAYALARYFSEADNTILVSTNVDIFFLPFNMEDAPIGPNAFYTTRRFNVLEHDFEQPDFKVRLEKGLFTRSRHASNLRESFNDPGDLWSLAVGCGDFQCGTLSTWLDIEGFEEHAAGRCYADSNVMKKAWQKSTVACWEEIRIAHLNHSTNGNWEEGEILPMNDRIKWVNDFETSLNSQFTKSNWLNSLEGTIYEGHLP